MPDQTKSNIAVTNPVQHVQRFILGELDHFAKDFRVSSAGALTYFTQAQLRTEPFVGYLEVEGPEGYHYLLICRNYTPTDLRPEHADCDFVSYYSPVGQLITSLPGEERSVKIPRRNVHFKIKQRNTFYPSRSAGGWDAIKNEISWIGGRRYVPSLRDFHPDEVKVLKRSVADKVQLPDQAILDQAQDTIFREPLNRIIVISGAPGTGKTTVLIKRLAQKTKYEFLTDEEKRLTTVESWQENRNWVLFTPSDLLKNYLKETLGKEHLPATDETVRVWSEYRLRILRALGFLKIGTNGYFGLVAPGLTLLKRPTNGEAVALTKTFQLELRNSIDSFYREEYGKFSERIRQPLAELRGGMRNVMEKALDYLTGAVQGVEQQGDPVKMGTEYRAKAQQIDELCRYAEGLAARGERKAQATLTPEAASQLAREAAHRLPKLTAIDLPEHLFPNLKSEIESLEKRIESLVEAISFNNVFNRIPLFFQSFRSEDKALSRFYSEDAQRQVNERKIDDMEMDALLWVALDFVTTHETIVHESDRHRSAKGRASYLLAERRGMIAVDEATDFSAVELGCMRHLADPAFGSVTICGDPMQRLTTNGIQDWEDLDEMVGSNVSSNLRRSYRQTARLLEVAMELYRNFMDKEPPFESAYELDPSDPPPLAFKATADDPAEAWITERIVEIWELNGERDLPSIGVFIPDGADEADWVRRLDSRLHEHSIHVEGSGNGMSLGNTNRVRVFPVHAIKGLEFEAAFFVDLDRIADKAPTLIDKYLYVGLSRARSYLGATYASQFPRKLACVRRYFSDQRRFKASQDEVLR